MITQKPYSEYELNYKIPERIESDIKEHGGIYNAIKFLEADLNAMQDMWSSFSCDSLGMGITCTRLKINRLKTMQP